MRVDDASSGGLPAIDEVFDRFCDGLRVKRSKCFAALSFKTIGDDPMLAREALKLGIGCLAS
jgi:hypothetical protein